MSISFKEQETIINFNRFDEMASVYTFEPRLKTRIKKLSQVRDEIVLEKDCGQWVEYLIPKEWIKINPPRILSEEERKQYEERGRKLWEIQKSKNTQK